MKFTEESLAIVGDWLKRTEEDLAQINKTEKGISIDMKQVSVTISLAHLHVHYTCNVYIVLIHYTYIAVSYIKIDIALANLKHLC